MVGQLPLYNPVVDLAGNKALPIGNEDFAQVIRTSVFVDKSMLVRDIIESNYKVILFCRPRRFGKSLAMRMLQCYFEAPVEGYVPDNGGAFESLAVWGSGERYRAERGAHPVVFLSLGSVGGKTWAEARGALAGQMASEYNRHSYLLESDILTAGERESYRRISAMEAGCAELEGSLSRLSDYLFRYHGAETVILIDEYDRPVTAGHLASYRAEAIEFMRSWLTDALKSTTSLRLACLTGVQRVSRESIFSGLNNVVVNTALDDEFTEGFGFTHREVASLLSLLACEGRADELAEWYDGYNFGGGRVYNPWSVLNYLRRGVAQPYWGNTSDNAIVHQLFRLAGNGEAQELRELASGGTVWEPLDLATVFSRLDGDPSAIWSQLYLAGYLTTDDAGRANDDVTPRELRVPNREVAWLYRKEFAERSEALAGTTRRLRELHRALAGGDAAGLEACVGEILAESPSYFDLTSENSYHMLLLGLVYSVPGYRFPLSNRESGSGRPDIVLVPERENERRLSSIVIEVKRARVDIGSATPAKEDGAALGVLAREALNQIGVNGYVHGLAGNGALCWGVACSGKHVVCAVERC